MPTYEFWTDAGEEDEIEAASLEEAAETASRRITRAAWRDGAWGYVSGPDGQMPVPSPIEE